MFRPFALLSPLMFATSAWADVPRVVADVLPVHSLVAQVMGTLGEPSLIVPPNASPHGYAMRPSEAASLADADVVFWVGDALMPQLEKPLESLASGAHRVSLSDLEAVTRLPFRESALFETHHGDDHGHNDAAHDDHGHEEHDHAADTHDDHGHEEHDHAADTHDDHGHEEHDHSHDHAAGGTDPHMWLDPTNALVWLEAIAEELAELDPDNAATYRANAQAGKTIIEQTVASAKERLANSQDKDFIVFHDAYQYFETQFEIGVAGAITLSDASDASPSRIAQLRAFVQDQSVACVFSEPQFSPALIETVREGTEIPVVLLDPMGTAQAPGAGLYPALLTQMAETIATCDASR